jgi:hypothetical protein
VRYIESDAADGCSMEPEVIGGDAEAWSADQHFAALFPAGEAMRDGGQHVAAQ